MASSAAGATAAVTVEYSALTCTICRAQCAQTRDCGRRRTGGSDLHEHPPVRLAHEAPRARSGQAQLGGAGTARRLRLRTRELVQARRQPSGVPSEPQCREVGLRGLGSDRRRGLDPEARYGDSHNRGKGNRVAQTRTTTSPVPKSLIQHYDITDSVSCPRPSAIYRRKHTVPDTPGPRDESVTALNSRRCIPASDPESP